MPRTRSIALGLASLIWLLALRNGQAASRTDAYERLLREASLALLKDGNSRFVQGHLQHPNQDSERLINTSADGQEPFATILACSDSRVPVELIFDRGVGDLFVIRVAGNIAGDSELASVEYGVEHLSTPLLVVLGHSNCGAVSAVANGVKLEGHLHNLVGRIEPSIAEVKAQNLATNELIPRAIAANVWHTISDILRHSDPVRAAVSSQKVQVVGAVYNLASGEVEWLGPHPNQESLLNPPKSQSIAEAQVQPLPEPAPLPQPTRSSRLSIPSAYLLPTEEIHQ